jgi:uncharacterized membrane protein YjgN (DUF898 family)
MPDESVTAPSPAAARLHITWMPPPGGFLGLSLLNGALRVITLGIYHFWGKTEVRQRIWSAIRINGEPLEYRGTGSELFRGFLIVFGLVLVPLAIASFFVPLLLGARSAGRGLYELSVWSLLLLLWGLGIHRARRYRLSRTRWRGIRAGLSGASRHFAWTYFWSTALVPLTLGWILPWRATLLQRVLFNETHFGDKAFQFSGRSGPLYKRFWLVWLSAVVLFVAACALIAVQAMANGGFSTPQSITGVKAVQILAIVFTAFLIFGMIRAWYGASMLNYFASQTTYQGATFKLNARVGSLIWLTATNYLLTVLTLGFLSPIAEARLMRYIIDRLAIDGAVPLQAVAQNLDVLLRRGEGLAEAFNVDAF